MSEAPTRRTLRLAYASAVLAVAFVLTVLYLVATRSELPREAVVGAVLTVAFGLAAILLIEFALWVAAGFPRRSLLAASASSHTLYAANPEAAGNRTLLEPAKREIQAASLSGPDAKRPYPPEVKTIEDEDKEEVTWT